MSCARIKNRPTRFLDPQEKLIIELRDEIKRLRNENNKLRVTLMTAPSSGPGGGTSGYRGVEAGAASEEDTLMRRAISAQYDDINRMNGGNNNIGLHESTSLPVIQKRQHNYAGNKKPGGLAVPVRRRQNTDPNESADMVNE